jgi:hypothetical protein
MEGIDMYVVCDACVRDFDRGSSGWIRLRDALAESSITPQDEARLRKLLDW